MVPVPSTASGDSGHSAAVLALSTVTSSEVGVRVISVSGELDCATRRTFIAACTEHFDDAIIIDLGGLSFMDCSGYSSLVEIRRMADTGPRTVSVRSAVDQPARLIGLIAELEAGGVDRRHRTEPADDVERRYSDLLAEFAQTMVTDFPIQAILDRLVERIVDVLPIDAAGVTLISPGHDPHYVAASDQSALAYERLQSELGEGPCIAAYTSGTAVSVPDLRGNEQFPTFARRAVADGLVAAFAFPLRHGDRRFGALDLYGMTDGALDDRQLDVAQTLANVAAAYLINAEGRADLEASTERANHLALHDPLTGLPNRTLLFERLAHAIQRCRRTGSLVAIMYLDLDAFKEANDTYGHRIGDEVLIMAAQRLTALLRPGDTLARLGGDEFAVLCDNIPDTEHLAPIAKRINDAFRLPFDVAAGPIEMRASIGIGVGDATSTTPELILEHADAAMYQAKQRGGDHHVLFDGHRHATDRASPKPGQATPAVVRPDQRPPRRTDGGGAARPDRRAAAPPGDQRADTLVAREPGDPVPDRTRR